MSLNRWLPVLSVTLVAATFAWLNRGERVFVDVGIFRFHRAPLTMVTFLAFLAGMLSMLVLSLRQDRRLREELRAHGLLEPAPARPAPAASAWGVARELEPRNAESTVVHPPVPEPSVDVAPADVVRPDGVRPDDDDQTVAYPRPDAGPAA